MVLIVVRIVLNYKLKIINTVKNERYAKENANVKMSY